MANLTLQNRTASGQTLEAVFNPDEGMSLVSLRFGNTEVIAAPSPVIGPHFAERHAGSIQDPFPDGIVRYAPWKASVINDTTVQARITGKDEWNGKALSALEGQTFVMEMSASLRPTGLSISLGVVGDSDALTGFGAHLALPDGKGRVISRTQQTQSAATIQLDQPHEALHHLFPDRLSGSIVLETASYRLQFLQSCKSVENSWFLRNRADGASVYVAALAAKDPKKPILTVNTVRVDLQLLG